MQEGPGIRSCTQAEVTSKWAKEEKGFQIPFTRFTVRQQGALGQACLILPGLSAPQVLRYAGHGVMLGNQGLGLGWGAVRG